MTSIAGSVLGWKAMSTAWPDTPKLYVCQIRIFYKPLDVPFKTIDIHTKLPQSLISQPLSWLGSPRQTESLYNYQPHHYHLTMVDDLIGVKHVRGEVYIAYLN